VGCVDAPHKEVGQRVQWTGDNEFVLDATAFRALWWSEFVSTSNHFLLAKERKQVEYYCGLVADLGPRNVVELGIYQGGSTAFFAALAKPRRMVAIELEDNPAPALQQYIADRGLDGVVSAHYGVDQSDAAAVRRIVETAFEGEKIDLVVDDASHELIPSRMSFNTLFPYVRPGGIYVIEDWALLHIGWCKPDYQPLSLLGFELLMAVGGRGGVIESVEVNQYVIAVKRGSAEIDPETFDIGRCYNDESRKLVPALWT
jgi:predicted O-methyltransferase YrrM